MPNLCIRWLAALALVAAPSILQGQPDGASPDLDKLREATGGRTGLAVHVGTSDGKLESALAQGGRMLVRWTPRPSPRRGKRSQPRMSMGSQRFSRSTMSRVCPMPMVW